MGIELIFRKYRYIILVFTGMLLGTALINILIRMGVSAADFLGSDYLAVYETVTVSSNMVWKYVLKARLKWFVFLVMGGVTKFSRLIFSLFVICIGVSSGALISASVTKYGIWGVLVFLISIFPQFVLYIFSFLIILKLFGRDRAVLKTEHKLLLFLAAAALLIAGSYLEASVNPLLLRKLYILMY